MNNRQFKNFLIFFRTKNNSTGNVYKKFGMSILKEISKKLDSQNKITFDDKILLTINENTFQYRGNSHIEDLNFDILFDSNSQKYINNYLELINPNYKFEYDNNITKSKLYLQVILIPFLIRCKNNKNEQNNIKKLYDVMKKYEFNLDFITQNEISFVNSNSNQNPFQFMDNLIFEIERKNQLPYEFIEIIQSF
jgi:hypothetical protein